MYNKVDARFFILFIFRDSNPHGLLIHVLKCLLTNNHVGFDFEEIFACEKISAVY